MKSAWYFSTDTTQHLLLFRDCQMDQRYSQLDDGFRAKQVGDSSTEASVKQNNPLPVLWSLGGAFLAVVLFGQASAEPEHGGSSQRQRVQASTDVCLHSHTSTCTQLLFGGAHWVLPIDISSLWENILTRWQKEIMRENVPYSHKWCQILRLSMTDALNLGTNGY